MARRSVQTGEKLTRPSGCRAWGMLFAALMAVSFASCGGNNEDAKSQPRNVPAITVRSELLAMMYDDQRTRDELDSIVAESGWNSPEGKAAAAEDKRVDSANEARLKEIVAEYGWPGKSLVGEQAALGAFLILQGADLATQEEFLPLFAEAATKGEVLPMQHAMLQDRILMRKGAEQIFGTQLWNDPSSGKLGLYPIRDSSNVDVRRDSVGLGPIGDYLRAMGLNPDTMTVIPPVEVHLGSGK